MAATATATKKRPSRLARPQNTYFTQVLRAEQITPHVRRLTFGGGDLIEFLSAGPDQFITLLLPHPGQERPHIHKDFTWVEFRDMPEEIRPIIRNYTVRRHRPDAGEIDVDFILHGDRGDAMRWAARAQPGDHLGIWGPRMGYDPDPDVEWQLLVGDETALPAIGAILESLPAGARARVIVEVADAAEWQPLPTAGDVEITWVYRDGAPVGEPESLVNLVRHVPFPEGNIYAWGSGEVKAVNALRQHLRKERGLARNAVCAIGYWIRDDHEYGDEDNDEE